MNSPNSSMRHCYIGSTERFAIGSGSKAIVVFSNPKDSNVTVYMNRISTVNLSNANIIMDAYCSTKVTGKVSSMATIVQGDLGCSHCTNAGAKIYSGTGNVQTTCRHMYTQTVLPYITHHETVSCNFTLPPGSNYVYVLDTITAQGSGAASMGFVWWEEHKQIEQSTNSNQCCFPD